MIFKTNSRFQSVTFNENENSWLFIFDNNIFFNAPTIWRLLENNKIRLVSFDHGKKFGLQKPFNLVEIVNKYLINKFLLEILVKEDTADLILSLTDKIQIEILISSSAFESYTFTLNDRNYIGLGSGDIAFYDLKG